MNGRALSLLLRPFQRWSTYGCEAATRAPGTIETKPPLEHRLGRVTATSSPPPPRSRPHRLMAISPALTRQKDRVQRRRTLPSIPPPLASRRRPSCADIRIVRPSGIQAISRSVLPSTALTSTSISSMGSHLFDPELPGSSRCTKLTRRVPGMRCNERPIPTAAISAVPVLTLAICNVAGGPSTKSATLSASTQASYQSA